MNAPKPLGECIADLAAELEQRRALEQTPEPTDVPEGATA